MRKLLAFGLFGFLLSAALGAKFLEREADQARLEPLQSFIGDWRGVGQLRRGSTQGSWREESSWAWHFEGEAAAIVFAAPEGKYLIGGEFRPSEEEGAFALIARSADGQTQWQYAVTLSEDGQLVATSEDVPADQPARLSIRQVAGGARLVMLLEKRLPGTDRFARLAEVGYTREGSDFAQGRTGPECVVTGGYGSIAVTYKGQTYYVCCEGCKQLFEADPEGILADYQARLEEERANQ